MNKITQKFKKMKKTKNMLTFVVRFDKIYLAAENGGKLFRKTSGLTAERVLKKMKKVVDKNESL